MPVQTRTKSMEQLQQQFTESLEEIARLKLIIDERERHPPVQETSAGMVPHQSYLQPTVM